MLHLIKPIPELRTVTTQKFIMRLVKQSNLNKFSNNLMVQFYIEIKKFDWTMVYIENNSK